MAFFVSSNKMEVKSLFIFVCRLVLSFCIKYFLGAILKLLFGYLRLVVNYYCLLSIEKLKHVKLFTYPVMVSYVITLYVFFGVN